MKLSGLFCMFVGAAACAGSSAAPVCPEPSRSPPAATARTDPPTSANTETPATKSTSTSPVPSDYKSTSYARVVPTPFETWQLSWFSTPAQTRRAFELQNAHIRERTYSRTPPRQDVKNQRGWRGAAEFSLERCGVYALLRLEFSHEKPLSQRQAQAYVADAADRYGPPQLRGRRDSRGGVQIHRYLWESTVTWYELRMVRTASGSSFSVSEHYSPTDRRWRTERRTPCPADGEDKGDGDD